MVGRLLLACYSLTALWQHFSRTTASLLATPTNDVSFNGPEASGNPEEMSGSVVVTEAEGLNLAADSISDNFGEELDPAVEEEEEWNTAAMAAKSGDLSALKKIAESSYAKLFEIITEAEGLISDDFGEELDPAVEEEEEWNTAAMAAKSGDLSALKKIGESSWAQLFETDENLWQPIHEGKFHRRERPTVIRHLPSQVVALIASPFLLS